MSKLGHVGTRALEEALIVALTNPLVTDIQLTAEVNCCGTITTAREICYEIRDRRIDHMKDRPND